MEHELFQSELKPSVDGTLISSMIRGSSLGLNSHRAAAMELIIERSIQDRSERMLAKAKDELGPDPALQPEIEVPNDATGSEIEVGRGEEPPEDVKGNLSPPEDFVELACWTCNVKQPRNSLWNRVGCSLCSIPWQMKCTSCGTARAYDTSDACLSCNKKLK